MKKTTLFSSIVLTAICATPASAATQTSSMSVSMTIAAGCTVNAGTLAFGTQSSLTANVDQQGSFSVNCTNTTLYTLSLDAGANGASTTTRRMKGGNANTEFVNYALYSDPARTTNWGGTAGADTVSGTGNGATQTVAVYGRVAPQTIGSPGVYTDNVMITVTY